MWAPLLVLLLGAPSSEPFLVEPDIHGDRVAFSSEGDIWIGNLKDGRAERLTRDQGSEIDARFSPDGTRIAFSAEYDGVREVYVMPVTGGAPTRLTYTGVVGEALGWTPDGRNVLYRTVGPPNNVVFRTVPATGGPSKPLPLEFASYGSFSPTGELTFTRFARYNEPWFGYEGGLKNDIWVADSSLKSFRRIYGAKGSSETPVWARGRVCFVLDEAGQFSVMSVRPDGSDLKRLAGPYPFEVRELASDGKRLIYEKGNRLETIDVATGRVAPVAFTFTSDLLHARPFRTDAAELVFSYTAVPGGRRALAESRGQIVSLPVSGKGEARVVLARDGARLRMPEPSPDGKRLAYVSDETGEQQLYVADAEGTNPTQLTADASRQLLRIRWSPDGKDLFYTDSETRLWRVPATGGERVLVATGSGRDGPEFDVSPDSKWIAYHYRDFSNGINSVYLYSIESRKTTRVSNGMTDDFAPAFTKDGRYLAILSRRTLVPEADDLTGGIDFRNTVKPYLLLLRNDLRSPFAPEDAETETAEEPAKPFRIDVEGLGERIVEVPVPAGRLAGMEANATSLFWVDAQGSGPVLVGYDLAKKRFARMASSGDFRLTPDGKWLLFTNANRAQLIAAEVREVGREDGGVTFGGLQIRVDPVAEWRQIYWEGWRYIRDYFYVANMHGLNWRQTGEKYAALLPSVRSRGELDRLFRGLLGELNVSHAGITGGLSRVLRRRTAAAFLGADLQPEANGAVRITRILKGDGLDPAWRSPLAEPGLNVKEGDYLIEVAGVPAGADESFGDALAGRVGEPVSILVNERPTREGARRILVRPMGSEFRLRYLDWVARRRQETLRLSAGKVGYVHLLSMDHPDMADFLRQYLPQRNKQALLIDLRFNTGGRISNQVMGYLRQRLAAFFNLRANQGSTTRQLHFFEGPRLVMVNEFSKSNGEEFPHQFRAEKLGKVLGRRTWGGEVGSDPGWPLVDGGKIWVPNYGAWTPKDGWIIEGKGIEPDIDVENDPNAFAQGRDVQLERAVKELLADLAKRPPLNPQTPKDPVRVRTGSF
jgi:tricorn protease